MKHIQWISLVLVFSLLMSCASHQSKHNIRTSQLYGHAPVLGVVVEFPPMLSDRVYVENIIDGQDAINTASSLASARYSAPPPGASAGEASAGLFIASLMMASVNKEKSKSLAEKKVENLNATLEDLDFSELLTGHGADYFNNLSVLQNASQLQFENKEGVLTLHVEPEVVFSHSLNRIKLKANIRIVDVGTEEELYLNTFEYWSAPLSTDALASEADRELFWSDNKAEEVVEFLDLGWSEIKLMFEGEYSREIAGASDSKHKMKTIRFESGSGGDFIRGQLLSVSESRFVVRDLRGNLKSIGGVVR